MGGTSPLGVAVCYTANVSCSNVDSTLPDLQATVAVSTPTNPKGTIFLHNGSGGTTYFTEGNGTSYAQTYYNAGFQVVQMAWFTEWQDNPNASVKVTKFQACRPATLVHYTYTNIHLAGGVSGGMCAQGHSAGSAAMAYALAWYDAGSYLDNVLLTSGPVYSNIEAGCQYPYAPKYANPIQVCPSGQYGCVDGGEGGWPDRVQYLTPQPAMAVAGYTDNPPGNCNNWMKNGENTSAYDQNWGSMSIVSAGANYTYPQTSLYAFLCSPNATQNNSAGQGQLFYQNFTQLNHPLPNYSVYRVDNCQGSEAIWFGQTAVGKAFVVSMNDMINGCVKNH